MSTFFGLTIAASGLRVHQASANTTANNISNVQTKGYSKQVVNTHATASLRGYTQYGTLSTGVTADSITQLRNTYYDNKYWQYSGYKGEYDEKVKFMSQIETYFQDDELNRGFSTIYAEMFNNLDTLSDSAADASIRNQFISSAKNFCSYFTTVANGLKSVQLDINEQVKSTVDQINSMAKKISLLNDQINSVEISGSYANELRDQRGVLIDELSTMVTVEVKETPIQNSIHPEMYTGATNFEVKINGLPLVDGGTYRELVCEARLNKINQSDAEGLYDLKWADSGEYFSATGSLFTGSLKALMEIRDGNANENFTGTVQKVDGRVVTLEDCSITNEEAMTMPADGKIKIGNKEYEYSDFIVRTDINNKLVYQFTITSDTTGLSSLIGRGAQIGEKIDYRGVPYYQAQMNEFIRSFAEKFNDIQREGVDMYGNQMGSFFVATTVLGEELDFEESDGVILTSKSNSYYQLTGSNLNIAADSLEDSNIFATCTKEEFVQGQDSYGLVTKMQNLQSKELIYRGSGGDIFLQYITSDVTVDTEESSLLSNNYSNIINIVTNQRMSISGVDEDEEALDLMKFQNAYNMCSKVISVMSEMYDRLILNTGV